MPNRGIARQNPLPYRSFTSVNLGALILVRHRAPIPHRIEGRIYSIGFLSLSAFPSRNHGILENRT